MNKQKTENKKPKIEPSMRMKAYLKMFVALVAMFATTACNDPEPDRPINDRPLCHVWVETKAITDTTLEFTIISEQADEVRYIFRESSESAPTADSILAEGTEVEANPGEANEGVVVKFEELKPFTKYTLHVAAKNESDTVWASEEAQTEESTNAHLSFEITNITENSAELTITSTNASEVKYLVVAEADGMPSNDDIAANGESVEPNTEVKVTLSDLVARTRYNVRGLATGENSRAEALFSFVTLTPAPVLTASLSEDIGYDYAVFNVSAENVAELKYVCIKAGSRDVTADQVLKNGSAIAPGDVKIEGLDEETAYEVYVAAKGLNEEVVMADALTFTTTKNIIVYTMSSSTTASAYQYSATNFYLTFVDEVNGHILNADFYVEEGAEYLTSGEYNLGGFNAGEISAAYTSFMFTLSDLATTTFSSGSLNVVATPNEETREVSYEIAGTLYFADGNSVVLNYTGLVEGIKLPEVIEGAPEGAYVFEVSPSTNMPKRVHGSNLKAGEYYIKFYDSNWNELTIDLFVDPALCNNGSDALPAGTYTTADGSFDTYSNISLYNPYFAGSFTEAELKVTAEGDTYTFTLLGTVVSGATEKVVYMNYTGEIAEMVK